MKQANISKRVFRQFVGYSSIVKGIDDDRRSSYASSSGGVPLEEHIWRFRMGD